MPERTTACQFCGRPWESGVVSRSDEHIWPVWIREHAGEVPDNFPVDIASASASPDTRTWGGMRETITVARSTLHQTTREVCKDCNTGWMSRLEQVARSNPGIRILRPTLDVTAALARHGRVIGRMMGAGEPLIAALRAFAFTGEREGHGTVSLFLEISGRYRLV